MPDTVSLKIWPNPLPIAVLAEVSEEVASLAEAAGIRVTKAFCDGPAIVSANRQALHRLFMVLLDNALKYSRTGGDVQSTARVDRVVILCLEMDDPGCFQILSMLKMDRVTADIPVITYLIEADAMSTVLHIVRTDFS